MADGNIKIGLEITNRNVLKELKDLESFLKKSQKIDINLTKGLDVGKLRESIESKLKDIPATVKLGNVAEFKRQIQEAVANINVNVNLGNLNVSGGGSGKQRNIQRQVGPKTSNSFSPVAGQFTESFSPVVQIESGLTAAEKKQAAVTEKEIKRIYSEFEKQQLRESRLPQFGPAGVPSLLRQNVRQQEREARQAKNLPIAQREFDLLATPEIAIAGLFGNRQEETTRQQKKFGRQFGVSGESLQAGPLRPNLGRLANPDALQQLGFAGLFGGVPSFAGGAAAGSLFGAPGVLIGSVTGQVASQKLEETINTLTEIFHKLADSGTIYQRSILGIASVLQANTQVLNQNGTPASLPNALAFQQAQAEKIQLTSRAKLAPIGITGSTEATLVQGITAALGQRGLTATPDQTAKISERIGSAILAQRPQLLENPTLLLRDIQDVISGGPQAQRTLLSQIIKPSISGIVNAQSAGDIEKATESLQGFVDAIKNSDNAVVQLNRLSGAIDSLQTVAGAELISQLTPGIKALANALSDPKIQNAVKNLGESIGGQLSEVLVNLSKNVSTLTATFENLNTVIANLKIATAAVLGVGALGGAAALTKIPVKIPRFGGAFEGVGASTVGSLIANEIKLLVEAGIGLVKKIDPAFIKAGGLALSATIAFQIGGAIRDLLNSAADDMYKKLEDVDKEILRSVKEKNAKIKPDTRTAFQNALGATAEEFETFEKGRRNTLGATLGRLRKINQEDVPEEKREAFDQFKRRKELEKDQLFASFDGDIFKGRVSQVEIQRKQQLEGLGDLQGLSVGELRDARQRINKGSERSRERLDLERQGAENQLVRSLNSYNDALLEAPDKFQGFIISLDRATKALEDFSSTSELRRLGKAGELLSAAKDVMAKGGTVSGAEISGLDAGAGFALDELLRGEEGSSMADFELRLAQAKFNSLATQNSPFRLSDEEDIGLFERQRDIRQIYGDQEKYSRRLNEQGQDIDLSRKQFNLNYGGSFGQPLPPIGMDEYNRSRSDGLGFFGSDIGSEPTFNPNNLISSIRPTINTAIAGSDASLGDNNVVNKLSEVQQSLGASLDRIQNVLSSGFQSQSQVDESKFAGLIISGMTSALQNQF